jgi:hypothetical protein
MRRGLAARTNQVWKLVVAWLRRSKSPRKTKKMTGRCPPAGAIRVPRHEFRIAAPGPTHQPDRSGLNMGPPPARRKRANFGRVRPAVGPIPGSAIRPRLINSVGFDKAKPLAVRRLEIFKDWCARCAWRCAINTAKKEKARPETAGLLTLLKWQRRA